MVYDRTQAESILARAQELDAPGTEGTFDTDALQRLADELDVSRQALAQAIDEATSRAAGPLVVEAAATIPQSPPEVTEAVSAYLRIRGLVSIGWAVWEQATGWWPDVYRYRAHTPVAVSITPAAGSTRVLLSARLDRLARAHVLIGLLAPLWLILMMVGGAPLTEVFDWLIPTAVWLAGSVVGFFYRREAIRRRLAGALDEVARPIYRQVPW